MILMQLNNISKSFGAEQILQNMKIEVKSDERIAIVGRNGAGKSTLLKIMSGELSYDSGELIKPKGTTVGYLPQHTNLESNKTIWNEMLDVFQDVIQQQEQLQKLQMQMESASAMDEDAYMKLLSVYDEKQQAFEQSGGYQYESDIKAVLTGLHFPESTYDTPIQALSGGQKTRLALGKLLLRNPDLLILDEPTNHLDIETLTWLEKFLASYQGAIVIVSHDRYFLDKTVSIVYEISRNQSTKYHGTYSKYLEKKAAAYERELKQYEKQQSQMKNMEDFIQRNIARASTTKRAQSKRKQLEKMDKVDKPLGEESSASFSFQVNRASGNDVLKINDFSYQYEGNDVPVFKNVSMNIERGESIALVGANGVGKTTLLKAILQNNNHPNSNSSIQLGTNVQIGYYDQEQADLSSAKTVLAELWDDYPSVNEKDIRTVLGNFLFSGDDVLKHVHSLSGGEKARLALAKLMMQRANLLIMDEPTNHLDIDSKEVLEAALLEYPGTILFISHDRYFINKLADQVVELKPNGSTVFLGNYDYYMEKKQEEAAIKKLENPEKNKPQQITDRKLAFQQDKEMQREQRKKERLVKKLEEEIEQLEEKINDLEAQMAQPEVFQDHEKSHELMNETELEKKKLDALMDEWAALQESISFT
ncbi:ABC-F family ATP-binding cassette domain-containing protein [Virgibacillus sp. W0181]|uniref:ABC-F family ATP-binding cassette domain-containing protein n=1 Tax=Virgibacillus sp. W0181 TaxID=3391581 RepID=UPI003F45A20F